MINGIKLMNEKSNLMNQNYWIRVLSFDTMALMRVIQSLFWVWYPLKSIDLSSLELCEPNLGEVASC